MAEITERLRHRGPDDDSTWQSPTGQVSFAYTRLSIVGLGPPGRQPVTSSDGHLTLIFNGEIYNYRELANTMGQHRPLSDTQVLVDWLGQRGALATTQLRGMYAWVAWDDQSNTLTAARDPFGIKPLYLLRHKSGGVTLASILPVLLLSSEGRQLDRDGLAEYVALGHTGPTFTMYSTITKIPPGSIFNWTLIGNRWVERIHRVEVPSQAGEPRAVSVGAAIEDAVYAHMVSDVEVGVLLGGGIDSTLIASIAAVANPVLRTFTVSFPDAPDLDEGQRAAADAAQLGVQNRVCPVTKADLVAAAKTFTSVHGEPFGDAAALPLTCLAHQAAAEVKVVMTGEGADELFGEYARYRVSRLLDLRIANLMKGLGRPVARFWAAHRGDGLRDRVAEALLWGGGVESHAALLGSDINALAGLPYAKDVVALLAADWLASDGATELGRAQSFDLHRWLPNMYLERTDRATMANALEARVPYLDKAVATSVANRPAPGKGQLSDELLRRLPKARLHSGNRGLAIDVGKALRAVWRPYVDYELRSGDGAITRALGEEWAFTLAARCERSPTLQYRLAMLGLWEDLFNGEVYS
jgi:asparagine synthase (glutamine-hydrolysing)